MCVCVCVCVGRWDVCECVCVCVCVCVGVREGEEVRDFRSGYLEETKKVIEKDT